MNRSYIINDVNGNPINEKYPPNKEMYGEAPVVYAIHAGLECGLFLQKYPDWDMVSIGPTMRGVHSPDECLYVPSVESVWNYLLAILERL